MKETFDIDIKDLEGTYGMGMNSMTDMTNDLFTLLLPWVRADLKKQKRDNKIQEILDSED